MKLPIEFVKSTRTLLGEKDYLKLEAALSIDSPVSIRINNKKRIEKELLYSPVPWCNTGYYLPERIPFTFDPLFHAGTYYVQEASSMFLSQAIQHYIKDPVVCLDLCAAPGGKSTVLQDYLPKGSLLVSNEIVPNRCQVLVENMTKWGAPDFIVTNNSPEAFGKLKHLFDVIVTDVPCSGEGMFRKDPNSQEEWSLDNVKLCANRQKEIINDVWEALKPGGLLIYSTCTYNTAENEENIDYIAKELGAEVLNIPIVETWGIISALKGEHPVYRFMPHSTKGEGFFLAVLRKKEGEIQETKKKKQKKSSSKIVVPQEMKTWLLKPESYEYFQQNESIIAFNKDYKDVYTLVKNQCNVVSGGVLLGTIKGKTVIPETALALSLAFNSEVFIKVELTWEQAIAYLRKEALTLSTETPRGFILVTYQKIPLGFVKHIGNRANNLYPQAWRIRSMYLPDQIPTLVTK